MWVVSAHQAWKWLEHGGTLIHWINQNLFYVIYIVAPRGMNIRKYTRYFDWHLDADKNMEGSLGTSSKCRWFFPGIDVSGKPWQSIPLADFKYVLLSTLGYSRMMTPIFIYFIQAWSMLEPPIRHPWCHALLRCFSALSGKEKKVWGKSVPWQCGWEAVGRHPSEYFEFQGCL